MCLDWELRKIPFEWEDQHLKWKPEDYNNIQTLTLANYEIWQPDIIVYENIPMTEVDTKKDTYVIVSKNGLVTWVPPIIVYSHCILNFENYPFDKQYCRITFGSWNHDGTIIDLQTDKEADVTRRLLNRNFKWKEWEDQHLKWKPEDYNNIQTLTLANYEIWQPDIIVYEK
ncbi:acetylcholine receptor subunit alpha-1-A-like [Centruroides sculpturatus]|uniref:acetylcholine receptor subunit alpha-1-A-like n=1 Tax=Centruroides sculpturatus TaxID=218467 RepID=UPI000C6E063E|nr:acetylcholine receptor subunit alpha-1-A-like [Centruroides sculpturatus]